MSIGNTAARSSFSRKKRSRVDAKLLVCKFAFFVTVCLLAAHFWLSVAGAQTAATGAITGTVTDSLGAVVANTKVTLSSLATNQTRTTTTGASGDYKFSLLPPGNYTLSFSASGFNTATVASVTVTVTETATVNQALQVGAVTQTVTVTSSQQMVQTESSALGSTVTGSQITALPMANGNYTEILSLSAGTAASVDNATSVGKGTQDISANGVVPGSNNFQMDGVSVDNVTNAGSANDATIHTGIPIPSTDAIQEFKVQTSTYDASYGRNPGANVVVNTKSGTNAFHGSAFEFFRNSVLNADDFFYDKTPQAPHEVLDQNQFGATLGGPIKKDKLFFFFSYRGTRSKNGVAPQGETFGAILPTDLNPYAALGSRGTCITPTAVPDYSSIASSCDATAQAFAAATGITNVVGLRIFQLTTGNSAGVKNNYYLPAPSSDPQFCNAETGTCNFSVPAIYKENQYAANGDYVINSRQTLTTKYFYSANPQTLYMGQTGGNLPGTPELFPWTNQTALAKLTSIVTNNFVNELRFSYQRNEQSATAVMPPGGCPTAAAANCGSAAQLGIEQIPPNFTFAPGMIDVDDNFSLFGGLVGYSGVSNQLQAADQISWQHGSHSIRAGFEQDWDNWPISDPGIQQGLLLVLGTDGIATGGNAGPFWNVGLIVSGKGAGGENGITHFYQLQNQDAYVLDDWKVNPRLTLNMGLRWELEGLISDKYGRATQVSLNLMAPSADVPTAFSTDPAGLLGYVVPSNFISHYGLPPAGVAISSNTHSITGHAPYSNFAPRFGFAWQPLKDRNLVVRGGGGIFYDRSGLGNSFTAYQGQSPYGATYDYAFLSSRWAQATLAQPYPAIPLVCMPSDPNCNTDYGLGFAPRFSNYLTGADSGLSAAFIPNSVHTPLVREYSLGIQYEFFPTWVLDIGYVGSSGINLSDTSHNHNQALLATPTNSLSYLCSGTPPICNTADNAQFRVPYPGYGTYGLQGNDNDGYSNYNSLQVTVRHQFAHGLTMQAAYTWDKDLSDIAYEGAANINEALCLKCQVGRVVFDRPQRFVVNYSYDLPIGKDMQGFAGKALGGWNVSGITIAQSGDPLTFISASGGTNPVLAEGSGGAYGASTTSTYDGVATAQYCPGFGNGNVKTPGSIESNVNNYFNLNAFCPAPIVPYGDATATGYGDSGVGAVLGPGQFNWDISLLKNTPITERVKMQFRADFYNAFNHPQFSDPGGSAYASTGFVNVASPSTIHITETRVNPRLIQFGLHFFF